MMHSEFQGFSYTSTICKCDLKETNQHFYLYTRNMSYIIIDQEYVIPDSVAGWQHTRPENGRCWLGLGSNSGGSVSGLSGPVISRTGLLGDFINGHIYMGMKVGDNILLSRAVSFAWIGKSSIVKGDTIISTTSFSFSYIVNGRLL